MRSYIFMSIHWNKNIILRIHYAFEIIFDYIIPKFRLLCSNRDQADGTKILVLFLC